MKKKSILVLMSILIFASMETSILAQVESSSPIDMVYKPSGSYDGSLYMTFPASYSFSSNKTWVNSQWFYIKSSTNKKMSDYGDKGDLNNREFKIELTATSTNQGLKEVNSTNNKLFQYELMNHSIDQTYKIDDWTLDNGNIIALFPSKSDNMNNTFMGRRFKIGVTQSVEEMEKKVGVIYKDTLTFGIKTLIINGKTIVQESKPI